MILKPSPISTDRFTAVDSSLLVAEASDLGLGRDLAFGRVYDDACDVGLTLVSHRTGREVVYVIERAETREGDLLFWELRPASNNHRSLPTVQIFND